MVIASKRKCPQNVIMMNDKIIWNALAELMDPEIPVVSLVDMGIIREITFGDKKVEVVMTPTFSGCPALLEMEILIEERLHRLGFTQVTVKKQLNPPWSSDWITDDGRAKLKAFGLQPPHRHGGNPVVTFFDVVPCPRCDSTHTTLKNSFGSTLCRSIWQCNDCYEPFEQFKAI
jgi:ring-1,2-phenylacetyl-CoA epoxidase subunit PaaD